MKQPTTEKSDEQQLTGENVEIDTVETITRRLRELAAKEAAESAAAASSKIQTTSVVVTEPNITTTVDNEENENFEVVEYDEFEEKRKLQSRGRFINLSRFSDKKSPKKFRKLETIDPPMPKPDLGSVVLNLSNNMSMKVLGNSENAFVPGFDPSNQGSVSWNDLRVGLDTNQKGSYPKPSPFGGPKFVGTPAIFPPTDIPSTKPEWKKANTEIANGELSGDEMNENRLVDMEDQEMGSNPEEDTILEAEATWTESSAANAYFQPQSQADGSYWNDSNYMYGAGDWDPMIYSELAEIRRQMKQLQKLPEQMKKVQKELQEIDKNVKNILKNVSKDPEEEPGRIQEVNPARHTDRLVSVPPGTKVLVLTDSICSRMNGYKINSELKVCVRSYGGLTVTEMITIVSTLDEDICYDIDYVFFHVGTNDLGAEDIPSLKSEFKSLIKRSLKIFSNATIFMSAILPRYGSTRELKDRQELNSLIANLSEKYNRVQFIDASCQFVEREVDNTLRGDLYKRDYIHLTLKGMGVLANSFKQILDLYLQQSETSLKNTLPVNNSGIPSNNSSDGLDCSIYGQSVANPPSFVPRQSAAYTSGYGDRSVQGPVSLANMGGTSIASITPAVSSVAVNTAANVLNPRQRISGRYTQYRR